MSDYGKHKCDSTDEDRGIDLFGKVDQEGYST
jgi:hypothetical protein